MSNQHIEVIITPPELARHLRIGNEAVRRRIRAGKLPPFDCRVSQKIRGWKPSTLIAAGIDIWHEPISPGL